MRRKKLSLTTRYVLLFGILLFLTSGILGLVTLNQSKSAMRELIGKNMLDIVKSAAGSLNGDELGALTANDVDGPVFNEVKERLLVYMSSVDIHFIYAVKQVGEGEFVFTVDPDPVDPGEFGEEVLTTPALEKAATGIAAVDNDPAADRWGNFYSAYAPVFDSTGKVAGVVGVDFDAEWYDGQVYHHSVSIAVVTSFSVFFGGVAVAAITNRVRTRFSELDKELSDLSGDVDYLIEEMASYSGGEMPEAQPQDESANNADELERLSHKIHNMRAEMNMYLEYLHTQAYTDSLTRLGNSTAYHEAIDEINKKISAGEADFWVAVYDVNSLKEINDDFGHEFGDRYLIAAAKVLANGFKDVPVFRIGGDEFAVVAQGYDDARMEERLREAEANLEKFNESERPCAMKLAISRGVSRFQAEKDTSFKDVFTRADQIMYEDKREYYRTTGDRRGRGRRG